MIFVSVGTERFPFDRLVRAVDYLASQLDGEPCFVQLGHSSYRPTACRWTRFLPYPDLVEQIDRARIVISHAGVGSILLCTRLRKVPIVVPRFKRFGEHVDDHQVELARRMDQLGYALLAEQPEALRSLILEYEERQAKLRRETSPQPALATVLSEYLNTMDSRCTR